MIIMPDPRIRHIPWTDSTGNGFGHHYITQDASLGTAEQFDIAIFPRGDSMRLGGDPLRNTPHIRIRAWDGQVWQDASVTIINRTHSQEQ